MNDAAIAIVPNERKCSATVFAFRRYAADTQLTPGKNRGDREEEEEREKKMRESAREREEKHNKNKKVK